MVSHDHVNKPLSYDTILAHGVETILAHGGYHGSHRICHLVRVLCCWLAFLAACMQSCNRLKTRRILCIYPFRAHAVLSMGRQQLRLRNPSSIQQAGDDGESDKLRIHAWT